MMVCLTNLLLPASDGNEAVILEAHFIIQSRDLQLLLQLLLGFGNQQKGKCTPQPEQNNL